MKITLYLILSVNIMAFSDFQNLLGKHISEIDIHGNNPKPTSHINKYYMLIDSYTEFYGIPYNYMIINTNNQDIIKDITIYISGVINRPFYDAFIDSYDNPKSIQITDKVKSISKSDGKGQFSRNSEKRFLTTKEGTFEEKPLYILWEKKGYQIKILLKHNMDTSEISFSLPTKEF